MQQFLFITVAVLLANSVPPEWSGFVPAWNTALARCALYIGLSGALGLAWAEWQARRLRQAAHPRLGPVLFAHYGTLLYHAVVLLQYLMLVYLDGWHERVAADAGTGSQLLYQALLLSPYLCMVLIGWLALYRFERQSRGAVWKLGEYLRFKSLALLPVLPVFFLSALDDLALFLPDSLRAIVANSWVFTALVSFLLVTAIYLLFPFFLLRMFPCAPLPSGSLRDKLELLAAKAGVGFRDILVWQTGSGRIPNAMVTGAFARVRYVFVTDELLHAFHEDEIIAVFGHELGHARHRHLQFYFALPFAWIWLIVCCLLIGNRAVTLDAAAGFAALGAAAALFFLLFGYLSRFFERQADLHGARICGDTMAFIQALDRIGRIAGTPKRLPSWMHYSLQRRIRFLLDVDRNPEWEARFRRRVAAVQCGFLLAVVLGGLALSPQLLSEFYQARIAQAIREDRGMSIRPQLQAALRLDYYNSYLHAVAGRLLRDQGDVEGAAREYQRALQLARTRDEAQTLRVMMLSEHLDPARRSGSTVWSDRLEFLLEQVEQRLE